MDLDRIPTLDGWLTGSEIARMLGISRQTVNRMMKRGDFKTVRRIGDRPLLVVRASEVVAYQEKLATLSG